MSAFLTPLREELIDPYANDGTGLWRLVESFSVWSQRLKRNVEAPVGFTHDHASVPIVPLLYVSYGNRYHRPAVIHDLLCRERRVKRETVDLVFLDLMRAQNEEEVAFLRDQGVDEDEVLDRKTLLEIRAWEMYQGVRVYTKSGLWKGEVDKPDFEPIG
jgi:hypothetical protein